MMKKLVIFGSLCCLVILSMAVIPMVKADGEFPYGGGPYNVYMVGKCGAVGNSYLFAPPSREGVQIGPFCKWNYPYGPDYEMLPGTFLMVNGMWVYPGDLHPPVDVYLYGFRGFSPGTFICLAKAYVPAGEIRIIGVADAIDLHSL